MPALPKLTEPQQQHREGTRCCCNAHFQRVQLAATHPPHPCFLSDFRSQSFRNANCNPPDVSHHEETPGLLQGEEPSSLVYLCIS